MFQRRTYIASTRSGLINLLGDVFSGISEIENDAIRAERIPLRTLFTGNPNAGKMLGVLALHHAFDDTSEVKDLLPEEAKSKRINQGKTFIMHQGQTRPFIFRHDSLHRLAPHYQDMVENIRPNGILACTAITAGPLGKIRYSQRYCDAFNNANHIYDVAIDMRTDTPLLKRAAQSVLCRHKRIKDSDVIQQGETKRNTVVTIEINKTSTRGEEIISGPLFHGLS